ncbi:MAG TPA: TlpA disulfide reductase family protein [Vicinamibacterales bacterium]|jgi:cytochrome c biogenesis protein CcmG/thiol:disulfide interchange protein DsbE|nr:TlpA disulfide reductase family protein [Vicinamibacterales bacterium]
MEISDRIATTAWIDREMAILDPEPRWQPDSAAALDRFRAHQTSRVSHRRRWALVVVAATAIGICLPAMSVTRTFAERCVDACVGLTTRVTKALRPNRTAGVAMADVRQAAPELSLRDADGALVELSALRGRVVVVNFWATWCAPCRVEMPWLVELQERYRGRGLTTIGVSLDDDGWASVRPFAEEQAVTYPLAIGDERVARAYGVGVLPTTFLVDRRGRIAAAHEGLVPKETYEQEIAALLTE